MVLNLVNKYHPFGMVIEERSKSYQNYRFGFNSQEKDDGVKGDGNSFDFGARIYDCRIGIWMSVDPLQSKYPDLSPYHFTSNNPIVFKDYDGRDYGIKVDNNKRTITVVATIYTIRKDIKKTQTAASLWNAQSGKYQVELKNVVKKGFLGIGREVTKELYDVNFEINVVDRKTWEKRDEAYENDNSGIANTYNIRPIGENVIAPDGDDVRAYSQDEAALGRGTSRVIIEDGWQEPFKTGSHEIGHILGIPHWNKGLMESGDTRERGEDQITKGMINEILSKVSITKEKNFSWGGNSDSASGDHPNKAKAKLIGQGRISGKAKVIVK